MNNFIYKIRDRTTGLFLQKGGRWSKSGKAWTNIGHLKNSLNLLMEWSDSEIPLNWEIMIYVPIPTTINCNLLMSAKFKQKDIEELVKKSFKNE